MVKESKFGKMDLNMKDNGGAIKQMVKANYITQMVTFTKVNGLTIKQMVKDYILI